MRQRRSDRVTRWRWRHPMLGPAVMLGGIAAAIYGLVAWTDIVLNPGWVAAWAVVAVIYSVADALELRACRAITTSSPRQGAADRWWSRHHSWAYRVAGAIAGAAAVSGPLFSDDGERTAVFSLIAPVALAVGAAIGVSGAVHLQEQQRDLARADAARPDRVTTPPAGPRR